MLNASPTIQILNVANALDQEHIKLLESAQSHVLQHKPGDMIVSTGDQFDAAYLVRSGWLARQRDNYAGKRQIVNIFMPGDVFGAHLNFVRWALFDIVAITPSEIAVVNREDLKRLCDNNPELASAMDWNTVRTLNIVSEHNVNLSIRSVKKRLLHLLLEFWHRLRMVGGADDEGFHIPLTQLQLGELCGVSIVSVNRALKDLRREGLIRLDGRRVEFSNIDQIKALVSFNPHLFDSFKPINDISSNERERSLFANSEVSR